MNTGEEEARRYDVFLAHASEDNADAKELHDRIESRGWSVFLCTEPENLELGERWRWTVRKALDGAEVVVVLTSEHAENAPWLDAEIIRAVNTEDRPVVPVVLRAQAHLPHGLEGRDALFVKESGGLPGVAEKLCGLLKRRKGQRAERIAQRDVVVDLSHGQGNWLRLAEALDGLGLTDRLHAPGALDTAASLEGASTLVLPLPFKVEFSTRTKETVDRWVRDGGGLLFLGHYVADLHHESDPSKLAGLFDFGFEANLLMPAGSDSEDTRAQVFGETRHAVRHAIPDPTAHPILAGVNEIWMQSSSSLVFHADDPQRFLLTAAPDVEAWIPKGQRDADGYMRMIVKYEKVPAAERPWLAAFACGKGRVVAVGSWKLLTVDEAGNRTFVRNVLTWLGGA